MMKGKIVTFPRKEKRARRDSSRKIVSGATVVGYARMYGSFVSVSTLARRALTELFSSSPTEERIAKELVELIQDNSISVIKGKDKEGAK